MQNHYVTKKLTMRMNAHSGLMRSANQTLPVAWSMMTSASASNYKSATLHSTTDQLTTLDGAWSRMNSGQGDCDVQPYYVVVAQSSDSLAKRDERHVKEQVMADATI